MFVGEQTLAPISRTTAATTLLFRSGLSLGQTCFNILLIIDKPSVDDTLFRLFPVILAPPCCCRLLTKRSPGCWCNIEIFIRMDPIWMLFVKWSQFKWVNHVKLSVLKRLQNMHYWSQTLLEPWQSLGRALGSNVVTHFPLWWECGPIVIVLTLIF